MPAKCVLASPSAGHRLRWHEILRLVKSRIQRWLDGDLAALWSEAVAEGRSLSRRARSSAISSQRSQNIRRAKLAVQDSQYSKAIKALTSDSLASPSAEVLQEMLAKHPQSAPPSLPTGPVPLQPLSPSLLSERGLGISLTALPLLHLVYAQAISEKPWGAPPLTRLVGFSPALSTFWLPAVLHLPSSPTCVVPLSWRARRSREDTVPSRGSAPPGVQVPCQPGAPACPFSACPSAAGCECPWWM